LEVSCRAYGDLLTPEQVLHNIDQICEVQGDKPGYCKPNMFAASDMYYAEMPNQTRDDIATWRQRYDPSEQFDDMFTSGFCIALGSSIDVAEQLRRQQVIQQGDQRWQASVYSALDSPAQIDWNQLLQ
ncbi:MAG: hypothetical protein ABIR91_02140, partial [Candidatus Saccharimonadales bacterium]